MCNAFDVQVPTTWLGANVHVGSICGQVHFIPVNICSGVGSFLSGRGVLEYGLPVWMRVPV